MQHTIVYTSDIHGNEIQYRRLAEYAIQCAAKSVIIGGDILPKNVPSNEIISAQRSFIQKRLPVLLEPLRQNKIKVYLMMGNDDAAANIHALQELDPEFFHIIHERRLKLTRDFDIVGYSCVPITPFGIKDWEKHDFSLVPRELKAYYERRKKENYALQGFKSTKNGWKNYAFDEKTEGKDSIQIDLSKKVFTKRPKQTVYVMHSPPDSTSLDMLMRREHVGSIAIRLFIEERQPYLTLHGHIHETVLVSGSFMQDIGETLCIASGNHDQTPTLALIQFDLYNPKEARRIVF